MTATVIAREVVAGGLSALPSVNTRLTVVRAPGPQPAWLPTDPVSPVSPVSPVGTAAPGGHAAPGTAAEAASRLEDLRIEVGGRRSGGAELVIARPVFTGDLAGEEPGTRYLVRWVTERGVHEVPASYLDRTRIGPTLIGWRLRVNGPVSRIQRRAHARVEVTVPVEITITGTADDRTGGPEVWSGLTVNLSEGGVLAAVAPTAPPVGSAVLVRFGLAEEQFALTGTTVRHQPTSDPRSGLVAVAIAFDTPDLHGDRLRPLLFARQLLARRVGVC